MRSFGLRYAGPEQVGRTFELICGRAYLNLGATVQSIDEALPLALDAKRLPATGERSVDVEHIPLRLAWRGWRSARRLPARAAALALRGAGSLPSSAAPLRPRFREKVQPAVTAEAARLREQDLAGLGSAELLAALRSHLQRFVDLGYYHEIADSVSLITHFLLRRSLQRLYGEQADAVEARLTTGLPGNFNTETNLDLARVAAGEIRMEEFLDRYGHRGSPDYEISAPRWREDPRRVEAMAEAIARAGVDPLQQFEEQQKIRAQAEAQLSAEIRKDFWLRPWRRAILGSSTTTSATRPCASPHRPSASSSSSWRVACSWKWRAEPAGRADLLLHAGRNREADRARGRIRKPWSALAAGESACRRRGGSTCPTWFAPMTWRRSGGLRCWIRTRASFSASPSRPVWCADARGSSTASTRPGSSRRVRSWWPPQPIPPGRRSFWSPVESCSSRGASSVTRPSWRASTVSPRWWTFPM